MQTAPDLGVLELAQVPVHVGDQVVEGVPVGCFRHPEVAVQLGRHQEVPDPGPDGRQLGRVQGGHLGVLVEQLLQPGHVVVGVGPGHRREQVVDDGGVGPALGLGAFARVVDDERVDEREVAEGHVGPAPGGQPHALSGQPFQGAVLAHVHDGVGPEALVQPPVEGEVVVRRREVR